VRSLLEPAPVTPSAAAACTPARHGLPGGASAAPAAPASEAPGSPAAEHAHEPCRDPGHPAAAGAPAATPAPPPPMSAAASPAAETTSGSICGAGRGASADSPPAAPGAAGGGDRLCLPTLPADPADSPAATTARATADPGAMSACSGLPSGGACPARAPCAAAEGGGARGPGRAGALADGEAEALRQQLLVAKAREGVHSSGWRACTALTLFTCPCPLRPRPSSNHASAAPVCVGCFLSALLFGLSMCCINQAAPGPDLLKRRLP